MPGSPTARSRTPALRSRVFASILDYEEKIGQEEKNRRGARRIALDLSPRRLYLSQAMQRVTIFTDGACRGNPGPGGWAAVLKYGGARKTLSGSARITTNNRMELMAAIEALKVLKRPCAVELFTDSEYLRKGIETWLPRWKTRGFRTAEGEPVKNQDLWTALERVAARHKVRWQWVRGHSGNPDNDLCDALAKEALDLGLNLSDEGTLLPIRKEGARSFSGMEARRRTTSSRTSVASRSTLGASPRSSGTRSGRSGSHRFATFTAPRIRTSPSA